MQTMVLKGCAVPDMVKSPNWHKSLSKTCDNPFAEQGFSVSALAWKRIAKKKKKNHSQRICLFVRFVGSKTFETVPVQHLFMAGTKLSSTATWHVYCHCDCARSSSHNWIVARALYLRSILSVSMNRYIHPSLNLRVHISSGPGQRRALAILPQPESPEDQRKRPKSRPVNSNPLRCIFPALYIRLN